MVNILILAMSGPLDPDGPLDGHRKKRDEDEAERLAGVGEDKYDRMYDSEKKKRLERHRDWRDEKREQEERQQWFENDDSVATSGSRKEFNGYLHALAFYTKLAAYVFLAIMILGAVVNPGSFGWEEVGVTLFFVAVILVVNYIC